MNFLEKDLEEIIFKANRERMFERGLSIDGKLMRQVRIGNYGIADLISYKKPQYHTYFRHHEKGRITIYELKKGGISVSAFFQAVRYAKGIARWIDNNTKFDSAMFDFEIVLIGTYDGKSDIVYLADLFRESESETLIERDTSRCSVSLYSYKFELEGIFFERLEDYKLTQEGF